MTLSGKKEHVITVIRSTKPDGRHLFIAVCSKDDYVSRPSEERAAIKSGERHAMTKNEEWPVVADEYGR